MNYNDKQMSNYFNKITFKLFIFKSWTTELRTRLYFFLKIVQIKEVFFVMDEPPFLSQPGMGNGKKEEDTGLKYLENDLFDQK